MRKRALLAGAGAVALGGCGFRPLYLPASGAGGHAVDEQLAAVFVPVISERSGQLLRQALQQRLEGSGYGVQKRYDLVASLAIGLDTLGIQSDSTATRYRYNGTSNWSLRRLDLAHTVLTTGSSRITDGLNIVAGQFFATDLETETVYKRITETLADQIVAQVAVFLRRQAAASPA